MAKHTPGPWTVRITRNGPYIVRGNGTLGDAALCKVLKISGAGRTLERAQEQDGNARLIAAAPEMRDLLERLTQLCKAFRVKSTVVDEARALLARIDGEGSTHG